LLPSEETISLQNPISQEMSVMRSSIWVNLITAVASNQKYQQDRVRLFEIGRVYQSGKDVVDQPVKLAGVISGTRYPEQWSASSEKVDFYDAKSDVQRLLPDATFEIGRHEVLHPGQSAQIILAGQSVGWLGMLHPRIVQQLKIVGNVALFEMDLRKIEQKVVPQYQHVSKYPSIHRDLAVVVPEGVTFQQVYDIVKNSAGALLVGIDVFDVYRGPGIVDKHKSLAIRLSLQHFERTLVEDEVTQVVQKVVENLRNNAQAELRE
jgi:phenylalanyl-tRNA synthetase beta chain